MIAKVIFLLAATLHQVVVIADTQPYSPEIGVTSAVVSFMNEKGRIQIINDVIQFKKYIAIFATAEVVNEVLEMQSTLLLLSKHEISTVVIDVDCFSGFSEASIFWKKSGLVLPVGFDNGVLSSLFKIEGLPFAIMVDQKGVLKYRGGLGTNLKENKVFYDQAIKLDASNVLEVTELPVLNKNLSHYPNCKGKRN